MPYVLVDKFPGQGEWSRSWEHDTLTYYPLSCPEDAEQSPWHFAPDEESGKPVERATLIYAHADDETIFAGGLLLAHPEWEWTLLRMTGNNDATREQEHADAIEMYRAEGVNIMQTHCFDGLDEWLTWLGRAHWSMAVARMRGNPDVVFTHGMRGEYGHPHHIALHHIVHTLYDNVWYFFHPSGMQHEPQLLMGRVNVVPTDERKRKIMETAYKGQWPMLSTAAPELVAAQFSGLPEYFTR